MPFAKINTRGGTGYSVARVRTSSSNTFTENLGPPSFSLSFIFEIPTIVIHLFSPGTLKAIKVMIPIFTILILNAEVWQTDKTYSSYRNRKMLKLIFKLRKEKPRSQNHFLVSKLIIIFYILLSYEQPNKDESSCLKNDKKQLFNFEYFKFCKTNYLQTLNENMSLLAFSQMKIKNRNKFLRILLLLSGDIEINPGPTQLDENTFSCFRNRGLHFLHLNINSVLTKDR